MLARTRQGRRHLHPWFPGRIRMTKRCLEMSHETLFCPKRWSTPLLVCDVLARRLLLSVKELKKEYQVKLTSLPDATHLRQGRSGSHPRCLCLQLTQAEGTCALARLVVLGGSEVVKGVRGR